MSTVVKSTGTASAGTRGRLTRTLGKLHLSPLTLALRWSLYIAALIVSGMGLLGWLLLAQQNRTHTRQLEVFGRALVEQLAFAASEPLMADDRLALQGLVTRATRSEQVLGVGIYREGAAIAHAGLAPFESADPPVASTEVFRGPVVSSFEWTWHNARDANSQAVSFVMPIPFRDVTAGYAVISLDMDILVASIRKSIQTIALLILLSIGVTVVMAFALGRRLSRPIQDLAAAGKAFDNGEPNRLAPSDRRDEIGQIVATFNRMASGIGEKKKLEATFSSYVSPTVARSILATGERPDLGGCHVQGSVLFCDIVGYTELSEDMPPMAVAELLNEYFRYIALAGHSCQGTVDKFIGDCVMVVFGAPETDGLHGLHAVTCAVLIREVVSQINRRRITRGDQPVHFRIGVNSGTMMAGNMGAPERMQFTVVGDAVNVASRLCAAAQPGQIVISQATATQPEVQEQTRLDGQSPLRVRGRQQTIAPYTVETLTTTSLQCIQQVIDDILPAESVH